MIVTSFKSEDDQSLIAMQMNVAERASLIKSPGFFMSYKVDETKFLTNQAKATGVELSCSTVYFVVRGIFRICL